MDLDNQTQTTSNSLPRTSTSTSFERNNKSQHLACDVLEARVLRALEYVKSLGMTVPQVAQAAHAPIQTVRYRLSQLVVAGIDRGEWHRRLLYYHLDDSGNDAVRDRESTK